MNNWMEKYERTKDEEKEKKLNWELNKLLDILDEQCRNQDKIVTIQRILNIYHELKMDVCDYDENDYNAKKELLQQVRYEIMELNYMTDKESQSWNDYKREELEEEELER